MITDPWTFRWSNRPSIGPTCPDCDVIHSASDVIAVGKFNPSGPLGYRVVDTQTPLRATRDEARKDLCALVQEATRQDGLTPGGVA